jgi:ribosomal protein S18 acetylase RimI-like enzyme
MSWSIRPATLDDVNGVLGLWREAGAEVTQTDDPEALRLLIDRDPGGLLVAIEDARPVGTIVAAWDGWRGQMYRLAVHPSARRRGLGTALVRAAEDRLTELGARRVAAVVVDDETVALAFWDAMGYERAPHARFTRTLQPRR